MEDTAHRLTDEKLEEMEKRRSAQRTDCRGLTGHYRHLNRRIKT